MNGDGEDRGEASPWRVRKEPSHDGLNFGLLLWSLGSIFLRKFLHSFGILSVCFLL